MRPYRLLLSSDAGEGSNGTTATAATDGKPDGTLASILKRNAELERELAEVKKDNADYRKKNRKLRDDLEAVKADAPSADADAELAAYRALGKPEEVATRLGEAARLTREKEVADFAKAVGIRPERIGLFARLTPESARLQVKEEQRDGKDVRVGYVLGDDGKPVAWDRYPAYADVLDTLGIEMPESPKGTPNRNAHRSGNAPPDFRPSAGDRQLDPNNPNDVKLSMAATGLGGF